ncbi:unnamed protein product [Ceutorhynchus assimilis]|uniref:Uncharacterized protein n=1 Tax=Ceutorhynchus assimilis TaxID=467358 RepID=A0A9N9MV08_9CUCU|nr:unnamed protein product [Ceutorhynchus assimilis]
MTTYCYRCHVPMERILTCSCGRDLCARCFARSLTCYWCYGPFTAAATLRLRRERLRDLSVDAFQAQQLQQEKGLISKPIVLDWPINFFLQIDDRLHANARAAAAAPATPAAENAPSVASEMAYFSDSEATLNIVEERERLMELQRRDRNIDQDLEMLDSDRSSDSFEFFMPNVARPEEQPDMEDGRDDAMDEEEEEEDLDAMFERDHLEGDPWENGNLYELEFDARIER